MSNKKHLEGIKIIDFSAVFAGPICSRYLLDCGADVIKVETPGSGDLTRTVEGNSRVFAHFNAGKRSIAVDLKQASGQKLVKQLIRDADVVIQNFRPGIMAKFGLDYDSLKHDQPDLIYCSISGFGQSGPLVNRAAYAPIIHAASGFDAAHTQAQENANSRPTTWDIMVADILTGTSAFAAVQTALLGKERNGKGEHIDVSMMESMMSLIPAHIQSAQMETPAVIGRFHPAETKDGYFMFCAVSDKNLQGLSKALNRPDLLEDPRFVRPDRSANFKQLVVEVEKWSKSHTAVECEAILNQAGVPASLYLQADELLSHPQVLERRSFSEIKDEELGDFLIQNLPMKFSNTETNAKSWVAKLGEHTDEILQERLNLSQPEIDALRHSGVVA